MIYNKKMRLINNRPAYIQDIANTVGMNKYKIKFIFNLYNNNVYKKVNNFNHINLEYKDLIIKYSSINLDLLKKNSTKFDIIRLNIVKNNENKNFN